jgi:4-amino-4-deoxy-L-arabinose transferase-like glycosyltransferase
MSDVTQNPPLASYYAAAVGALLGWSESALHLWFLVPAVTVVLGTFHLARRFTRSPLLAALCTLLTPGFLVSALSVMCDTLMLALWILAIVCWVKGEDSEKSAWYLGCGVLIALAALTKYFGIALVPLLLAYSIMRRRRITTSLLYLLMPAAALAGYEYWTSFLYGQGLFTRAAEFANAQRDAAQEPWLAKIIVAMSFTGGCALTGTLLSVLLWSRKQIIAGLLPACFAGTAILAGWLSLGMQVGREIALSQRQQHWALLGTQLVIFIGGGISIVALAIADFRKHRNADSLLLLLWALGTFIFVAFINWTANARSLLPLIPTVAILIARRLSAVETLSTRKLLVLAAGLLSCGAIALWVGLADTNLANDSREAAALICKGSNNDARKLWFEGHWGFQYYMEACGAEPIDRSYPIIKEGDLVVIPSNNIELVDVPAEMVKSVNVFELTPPRWATTIRWELGAGFYSSLWGPLPFVIGPVPPERYKLVHIGTIAE